jgi:hypothetical protein
MNTQAFIKAIESYYGKYKPGTKRVVVAYLEECQYSQTRLRQIWRHIVETVSGQYNFVPDVAVIHKAYFEVKSQDDKSTYVKQLPDPLVRSMKIETGEMLKRVLSKVSLRRKRENEKATG